MKEGRNDLPNSDEILEQNLSKITDPQVDAVIVMFPYNQKSLFVPDDKDWSKITKEMRYNSLLIVSPNALKAAEPAVSDDRLIITVNEMILSTLKYWEEIRNYITANSNIKDMTIVASDIDIERIKRDYNLVFSNFRNMKINYSICIIPNSTVKIIYKIREKLVLALPIGLYEVLGKFR